MNHPYPHKPKNTICLWFNGQAEEAARFYAATIPDTRVLNVHHAPADYPAGRRGDVLTQALAQGGPAAERAFAAMMTM